MAGIVNHLATLQVGKALSASGAVAQAASPTGIYRGQVLTVKPSLSSLINDALEELTTLAGEKAEEKEKSRHELRSRSSELEKHKEKVKKVQEVMDRIQGFDIKTKFTTLSKRLSQAEHMNLAGLDAEASSVAPDVSERYILLTELKKDLVADNPKRSALADQSLTNLMREYGPQVRAGLNISERAYESANGDLQQTQELRDLYRDQVVGYQGLAKAYVAVTKRFGVNRLQEGADFLIHAAGDDLGSSHPSLEPTALQTTLDELFELHTLVTINQQSGQLIGRMQRMNGIFQNVKPESLIKHLLDLTSDPFADSSKILGFAEKLGARDTGSQINFVRELRSIAEQLPFKLFANNDERSQLMDVFRQAQDVADEREADELG